jgi:predicted DNA-binding protein (UPF0251 family)
VNPAIATRNVSVAKTASVVVSVNNNMVGRPKVLRNTNCVTKCTCFKPNKVSKGNLGIDLMPDEIEVVDLCDRQGLVQKEAAERMKISQPTLARILSIAHKKIAEAIIGGEEIRIN